MKTTKTTIDLAGSKKPEQMKLELFSQETENINVIVYGHNGNIEKLVFASTDELETRNKLDELKTNVAWGIKADGYHIMTFINGQFIRALENSFTI